MYFSFPDILQKNSVWNFKCQPLFSIENKKNMKFYLVLIRKILQLPHGEEPRQGYVESLFECLDF